MTVRNERNNAVVLDPDAIAECRLATELRTAVDGPGLDGTDAPVRGFGASDCDCPAHLLAGADSGTLRAAAVDTVEEVTSRTT